MKLTAPELYTKLVDDYKIIGETAEIKFSLRDLTISVETKDTVGNLLQEWLKSWLMHGKVEFIENNNSQVFPDFYLDKHNQKIDLLEVKTFNYKRGPGFDLANFDSYCNSLTVNAYRIDSDYLVFAYEMHGSTITIKNVWLKKIWELAGPSKPYPIKVQEKKNIIYNIRPTTWYSTQKTAIKPFASKEEFLSALNETRYKYPQTRFGNAHWLQNVIKNYQEHTGILLDVK